MKRLFIKSALVSGLFLVVALDACSAGSSPTPISSSAQVVKVTASPVSVAPNGSADAVVILGVSSGFHINANPATFSYLIATKIEPGVVSGIKADKPVYPAGTKKTFQFADQALAVYEGEVSIKLPLRVTGDVKEGQLSLPVQITVQACDEEKCYPPATLNSTISVTVK